MSTPDLTEENVSKIANIFPSVITEKKDEDGNIVKGVDFDLLRQVLSKEIVEGGEERYRLDWPGKKASILKANTPITDKTLRPAKDESVDFDNTENLYVEGDNFQVLKLLQESYLNKVKMIYIDPPYNTGRDFVYKDNFTQDKDEYNEEIGVVDGEGNKLFKNTESNGRFHSDWLSMMYERLVVARDLLKEDGVIFISIDDNEISNLKNVCDEIFGEKNFIDIFNWSKTETPANLSKKSKKIIEYILCYQKNINDCKFKGVKKNSISSNGLLNQTNVISVLNFPRNKVVTNLEDQVIKKGKYGTDKYEVELLTDTEVKAGFFVKNVELKSKFKWSQEYLENEISNGTVIKIPTINFSPAYEKKEYDPEVPPNLINIKVGVGTNENAGDHLSFLFENRKIFDYPKPVNLLKYLFNFNINEGDIVMDFFAGSSTMAEAVMEINFEKKCKYICVQLPEKLNLDNGKNDAEKQIIQNAIDLLSKISKPLNIAEIGKERIRRAAKKIQEDNKDKDLSNMDFGFRVFKLDSSNMKDVYYNPKDLSQDLLSNLESNIKEDRSPEDLLTQVLLDLGLELSYKIETKDILGNKVFFVGGNDLVACFDDNINFSIIDEIAKVKPLKVVFKDASFKDDKDRINVEERFKRLSPETSIKVI